MEVCHDVIDWIGGCLFVVDVVIRLSTSSHFLLHMVVNAPPSLCANYEISYVSHANLQFRGIE